DQLDEEDIIFVDEPPKSPLSGTPQHVSGEKQGEERAKAEGCQAKAGCTQLAGAKLDIEHMGTPQSPVLSLLFGKPHGSLYGATRQEALRSRANSSIFWHNAG